MYRGGNGVIRAFTVMEDGVRLTVTGERVKTRPWGLHGGLPGEPAVYAVERRDGRIEVLPSKGSAILYSGDTVVVKTPGGGGYGNPCRRSRELLEKDIAERRVTGEWLERLRGACKG